MSLALTYTVRKFTKLRVSAVVSPVVSYALLVLVNVRGYEEGCLMTVIESFWGKQYLRQRQDLMVLGVKLFG